MKKENYILIQGFMVTDLKLKGNELLAYAIIYGFSQEEGQTFRGSLSYLEKWLNASKQTVINTLKSLVEKGLIKKTEKVINNIKFCEYSCNIEEIDKVSKNLTTSQKDNEKVVKKFDWGSQKNRHNNINNNINNKIDDNNIYTIPEENLLDEELDVSSIDFKNNFLEYKELVSKATGMGMNIVDNLMANIIHTLKSQYDIKFLIQKIKESDFLMGKLETKPSTANFSKKVMLDRIMADEYKNKISSKQQEIKSPATRIIGDINPWEVED